MKSNSKILIVYFVIALVEITGDFTNNIILVYFAKPLLMPILILWLIQSTKASTPYRALMIVSLIASFFGDTFLMLLPYSEQFFLVGLGSFLVTQILYSVMFYKQIRSGKNKGDWKLNVLWFIVFGMFYIVLMRYLWPHLNDFLIPVLVYGTVICIMGLLASYRYNKVTLTSYLVLLAGAICFIFSDTIIAINQFIYLGQMAFAQESIMILYVVAQYLIVKGWLVSVEKQ